MYSTLLNSLAAELRTAPKLLCCLAAEVGHGRGRAVALKAELNVAREVVLIASARATDAERGERGVAARDHELHAAERTERRDNCLAHVAEDRTASRHKDGRHQRVSTRAARAVLGSRVRPVGRGEVKSATRGVERVHDAVEGTDVDVVIRIRSYCLDRCEQGRHLYIPELEKNSGMSLLPVAAASVGFLPFSYPAVIERWQIQAEPHRISSFHKQQMRQPDKMGA